MADSEARALDRAARAGDPEAEVRALRERLRRGAVSREQVALLAYAGDVAAREVLGWVPCVWDPPTPCGCDGGECHNQPEDWARGLAPLLVAALDREAVQRVLSATDEAAFGTSTPPQVWTANVETTTACLEADAARLGPRLRPVVLAAVRREVWGG